MRGLREGCNAVYMSDAVTSLNAAKAKVLDYLAGGKFTRSSVRVGSKSIEFRSASEAVQALREIGTLLADASGTASALLYAKNAGRGRVRTETELDRRAGAVVTIQAGTRPRGGVS